jgi:hypothetical protein
MAEQAREVRQVLRRLRRAADGLPPDQRRRLAALRARIRRLLEKRG